VFPKYSIMHNACDVWLVWHACALVRSVGELELHERRS